MRIAFTDKPLEQAPAGYARVRLTEEKITRLVREGKTEWLEIGTGMARAEVTLRRFRIICRGIVRMAKEQRLEKIAVQLDRSPFPQLSSLSLPELGAVIAESFTMAAFEPDGFKTRGKDSPAPLAEVLICGKTPKEMRAGFDKGRVIGEEVNACRELANTPGGDMTPTKLAMAAKRAAKGLPIAVKALGRREMAKLGMGAVLGVAKGSSEEPKFIVMEYGAKATKPIVLVGKGVTFDSGGLNVKPEHGMYEMHMDMSGGAAVIHAVALAAKLKLKKRVVGLIPAVENMSNGEAFRPGDILKSLSGKTIEVLNTDAEGRLILADALTYAKRYKPAVVLDAATLTGASMVALGTHATALMTRDDRLSTELVALGETSGDYLWPLPLWDEYQPIVKSDFADVANVPGNGPGSRLAGAIGGGMFLWQFAQELECPWAHLDIAPRMTAAEGDKLAKGAAGAPVRLFVRFIESWQP